MDGVFLDIEDPAGGNHIVTIQLNDLESMYKGRQSGWLKVMFGGVPRGGSKTQVFMTNDT